MLQVVTPQCQVLLFFFIFSIYGGKYVCGVRVLKKKLRCGLNAQS